MSESTPRTTPDPAAVAGVAMISVRVRSVRVLLLVLALVSAGPPWVYHVSVEPYLSAMPIPA